ncbi:MAG: hypothetical protein MUE81_05940 [Thermoflexibacter sp.]|nr:hypothetical protein [Thermoflexibacter sp.]
MKQIIVNIIRLKLQQKYIAPKLVIDRILLIILGTLCLLSGYVNGFAINIVTEEKTLFIIIQVLNFIFFMLSFFKNIIPFYKSETDLFKSYHPVSISKRFFINVFYEIFSPYYFFILIYFLGLFLEARQYDFLALLNSIILLFTSIICRKIVKANLENGYYSIYLRILIASFFMLFPFFYFLICRFFIKNDYPFFTLYLGNIILFIAMLFINFFVYKTFVKTKNSSSNYNLIFQNSSYISIYLKNSKIKSLLLMLIIIKVLGLLFSGYIKTKIPFNETYLFLFISPILIFTYIHNNIIGFFKTVFLTIINCPNSSLQLLKTVSILLLTPIFLDITISVSYYYIAKFAFPQYLLSLFDSIVILLATYISNLFILTILSIYFSLLKPIPLNNTFQTKNSTYLPFTMLSIILSVTPIFFIGNLNYLTMYMCFTLVLTLFLVFNFNKFLYKQRTKVFETVKSF